MVATVIGDRVNGVRLGQGGHGSDDGADGIDVEDQSLGDLDDLAGGPNGGTDGDGDLGQLRVLRGEGFEHADNVDHVLDEVARRGDEVPDLGDGQREDVLGGEVIEHVGCELAASKGRIAFDDSVEHTAGSVEVGRGFVEGVDVLVRRRDEGRNVFADGEGVGVVVGSIGVVVGSVAEGNGGGSAEREDGEDEFHCVDVLNSDRWGYLGFKYRKFVPFALFVGSRPDRSVMKLFLSLAQPQL
ncbi:hypothetical protein BC938DRAFT_472331 [Jimgerdemannia flammicorona]|uniref:Uncharacterized protein n=1 Tax=Jimgerdemannia flammicorona TaxID=994334 RepID=A0A433QTY9_9FUNG|nr:hypothetical protein BC938DRAFT_472331 [Jimgerdemannia flammicorona]